MQVESARFKSNPSCSAENLYTCLNIFSKQKLQLHEGDDILISVVNKNGKSMIIMRNADDGDECYGVNDDIFL